MSFKIKIHALKCEKQLWLNFPGCTLLWYSWLSHKNTFLKPWLPNKVLYILTTSAPWYTKIRIWCINSAPYPHTCTHIHKMRMLSYLFIHLQRRKTRKKTQKINNEVTGLVKEGKLNKIKRCNHKFPNHTVTANFWRWKVPYQNEPNVIAKDSQISKKLKDQIPNHLKAKCFMKLWLNKSYRAETNLCRSCPSVDKEAATLNTVHI